MLVEAEDDLHPDNFVCGTELNGLRGTHELHRISGVVRRDTDLFEVIPGLCVLKQNFHRQR